MSPEESRDRAVAYLLSSAEECLESAHAELTAGRLRFAINRAYYACFYALSAVLVAEGRHFVKHTGVRAALHRDLIRTGRIDRDMGRIFDELFNDRQESDYGAFAQFEVDEVADKLSGSERLVDRMKQLLA